MNSNNQPASAKSGKKRSAGGRPLGPVGKVVLGIYHIVAAIILLYLVVKLWPTGNGGETACQVSLFFNALHLSIPGEIRLLFIVIVSGALGSYIHSATSFADFVGNRTITSSWMWWYILRSFIGMALSVVLYFVVRAGFISINASSEDINPFGFAAIAGMAGMFSKQAIEKLREVFDNLFKTAKETSREDPLGGGEDNGDDENVQ